MWRHCPAAQPCSTCRHSHTGQAETASFKAVFCWTKSSACLSPQTSFGIVLREQIFSDLHWTLGGSGIDRYVVGNNFPAFRKTVVSSHPRKTRLLLQVAENVLLFSDFYWQRDSPQWARTSSLSRLHEHAQTHHTRQDSSGWVISPSQKHLPDTQHTTLTRHSQPYPRRDSNPQFQQASGRRPTLLTALPLGTALLCYRKPKLGTSYPLATACLIHCHKTYTNFIKTNTMTFFLRTDRQTDAAKFD